MTSRIAALLALLLGVLLVVAPDCPDHPSAHHVTAVSCPPSAPAAEPATRAPEPAVAGPAATRAAA
ncbi:hypothetical protein, partial [Streptomyces bambusae]